jgi:hypothetical protein
MQIRWADDRGGRSGGKSVTTVKMSNRLPQHSLARLDCILVISKIGDRLRRLRKLGVLGIIVLALA